MPDTDREKLGRLVRETWVTWAKRHRRPEPVWLIGWDRLDADKREACMLIGEAVAAAERARIRSLAVEHGAVCHVDFGNAVWPNFADILDGEMP